MVIPRYAIIILVNILYLHLYIVSVYRYTIPNLLVLVSQATEFPCIEDSNKFTEGKQELFWNCPPIFGMQAHTGVYLPFWLGVDARASSHWQGTQGWTRCMVGPGPWWSSPNGYDLEGFWLSLNTTVPFRIIRLGEQGTAWTKFCNWPPAIYGNN